MGESDDNKFKSEHPAYEGSTKALQSAVCGTPMTATSISTSVSAIAATFSNSASVTTSDQASGPSASSTSMSSSSSAKPRNFGDLLQELLQTLPQEASSLFLQSLSGLSPEESFEFCDYVNKLKAEKQFRVIKAMGESTIEGKKKFLVNLRKKFANQQQQQAILQSKNLQEQEEVRKRKEALYAAARVKMLSGNQGNKYHSYNATHMSAAGAPSSSTVAASPIRNNGAGAAVNSNSPAQQSRPSDGSEEENRPINRAYSSSSVLGNVTKEDIREVGQMLGMAHIGESEANLRMLEISKKGFVKSKQQKEPGISEESASVVDSMSTSNDNSAKSKRDRSESSRQLVAQETTPVQKPFNNSAGTIKLEQVQPVNQTSKQEQQPSSSTDDTSAMEEDPDAPTTKRWTKSQDAALRESVRIHGEKNWKAIAELVPGRNHAQCLQRWRKVLKPGLVKGHWSFEEDQVLEFLVTQGCNNWGQIAEKIPGRTPKQCRERWKNHLDPSINKGPYTEEEDAIILTAQERLGNKWSQIAQLLKGRTEDSVKIRWKSLKQNPAKAAASHGQRPNHNHGHGHGHSQNQRQARPMTGTTGSGSGGNAGSSPPGSSSSSVGGFQAQLAGAFSSGPSLHHRQMQIMQQQDAQQQIQQQQLQLRLQQKLLEKKQQQQQQLSHASSSTTTGSNSSSTTLTPVQAAATSTSVMPNSFPLSVKQEPHVMAQPSSSFPGHHQPQVYPYGNYTHHGSSPNSSLVQSIPLGHRMSLYPEASSQNHPQSQPRSYPTATESPPQHFHDAGFVDNSYVYPPAHAHTAPLPGASSNSHPMPPQVPPHDSWHVPPGVPQAPWDDHFTELLNKPISAIDGVDTSNQQRFVGHNNSFQSQPAPGFYGTSSSSVAVVEDEDEIFEKLATELESDAIEFVPLGDVSTSSSSSASTVTSSATLYSC